jgi:hypothetical protein
MMSDYPLYIVYEIADISIVLIDEFRAWSVVRADHSFLPEGKFLKQIDRLRLTLLVAFRT